MKRLPERSTRNAPLAAHRLADERARCAGDVQRRRVELHERHVRNAGAGAEGHRDAVAGGAGRVRRLAPDGAGAAGGQYRRPRPDDLQPVPGVVRDRAHAGGAGLVAGRQQVEREAVVEDTHAPGGVEALP
jgi:hypothetical protein